MRIEIDKAIRFSVLFMVLSITVIGYPDYAPIPQITALLIAKILSYFLGAVPVVYGNSVLLRIDNEIISMDISPECSALIAMLLFIFVIFITPGIKLQHRLYSLLFILVLYIVNLFRIISEVLIGSRSNIETMSIYHAGVGQVVFFSAMILLYISFLKMFGYMNNRDKHASTDFRKRME